MSTVVGIEAAPPTICRLLWKYGITRRRIRLVALQRCKSLRGAFMAQCSLLGTTPACHRLLHRGQRYNCIAAIATTGLVALEVITRAVNTL